MLSMVVLQIADRAMSISTSGMVNSGDLGQTYNLFQPLSIVPSLVQRLSYMLEIFPTLIGISMMMLVSAGIHGVV